jgi:hypothetical protein
LATNQIKTGYLLYAGDIEQQVQNFNFLNIMHLDIIFSTTQ